MLAHRLNSDTPPNLAGSLTSETYPSGRVVTTDYDALNRLDGVSGTLNGQTAPYSDMFLFAPHGGPTQFRYGNNLLQTISYNSRLQMSGYVDTNNNDGSQLLSVVLDWGTTNDNGNLRGATFNNGGPGYPQFLTFQQTYGYDGVNRVNSVNDTGGWSRSFQYDPYGNAWVSNNAGVTLAGNTPTANVYTTANRINGASYDNAGNQLVVNGNTLAYDAENRQISVTDGVTHAVENYLYDGNGQRVEKTGPGGTTVYVYDVQGQLATEYSTANSSFPCTMCYLSADHLGSTRLVTDASVNVIARHDYLPFGEEIPANTAGRDSHWGPGNDTVNQKFTGKERDTESGLDYFGARYYGSALGRFTSPDEFKGGIVDPFTGQDIETNTALPYADITDPQTLNKYAYVRNNPLRYTDPNGHCIGHLCLGEGALVYAGYTALAGATAAYLASPSGQQAIQATGQLIQSGLNGIQNFITLATGNNSQQAQPPPGASSGQQTGSKSAEEMASDLKDKIGKNSVPYDTPTSKGRIDLAGKGHFDKATGQVVDTPHVQEGTKNVGPNGQVNIGDKTVRPATKQDIRTAEKLAKRKGWLQE